MIGSVSPMRTPLRNGSVERTSGNAAAVPTIVAIDRHLHRDLQRRRERVLDLVVVEDLPEPAPASSR